MKRIIYVYIIHIYNEEKKISLLLGIGDIP